MKKTAREWRVVQRDLEHKAERLEGRNHHAEAGFCYDLAEAISSQISIGMTQNPLEVSVDVTRFAIDYALKIQV